VLRVVADARLLGQLVDARQAHPGLPAVEQQEALDLLVELELNYLPTLAATEPAS
jgi:hypothetical protein